MIEKNVQLINVLGLHARAASAFVKMSSQFSSEITIKKDGHVVSGKSILGIMTLGVEHKGWITLCVDGEDQELAMERLVQLIAERFGEEE